MKNVKKISLIKVVLIGVMFMFLFLVFGANAFAKNNCSKRVKYITNVTIEYGDTLTSIAQKYYTEDYKSVSAYIEEIKKTNNMYSDKIIAGDKLIVPYYIH